MENKISKLMDKYTKLTPNTEISKTKTMIYTIVSQNPKTKEITFVEPCTNLYKVKDAYRK